MLFHGGSVTRDLTQWLSLQIDTLSSLGRLEELTIRHNPILRQVLLRPYICFCLPKLKVGHQKRPHFASDCGNSVHRFSLLGQRPFGGGLLDFTHSTAPC